MSGRLRGETRLRVEGAKRDTGARCQSMRGCVLSPYFATKLLRVYIPLTRLPLSFEMQRPQACRSLFAHATPPRMQVPLAPVFSSAVPLDASGKVPPGEVEVVGAARGQEDPSLIPLSTGISLTDGVQVQGFAGPATRGFKPGTKDIKVGPMNAPRMSQFMSQLMRGQVRPNDNVSLLVPLPCLSPSVFLPFLCLPSFPVFLTHLASQPRASARLSFLFSPSWTSLRTPRVRRGPRRTKQRTTR